MAFLCSDLQVAVETQSQTRALYWHTECRECRILLPPSGDTGQNRAIVPNPAQSNKCCKATIGDKTPQLTNINTWTEWTTILVPNGGKPGLHSCKHYFCNKTRHSSQTNHGVMLVFTPVHIDGLQQYIV